MDERFLGLIEQPKARPWQGSYRRGIAPLCGWVSVG